MFEEFLKKTMFSIVAIPVSHPLVVDKYSLSLKPMAIFVIIYFIDPSYFDWGKMNSQSSLNLYFSDS